MAAYNSQTELKASLVSRLTPVAHSASRDALRAFARNTLGSIMGDHGLDIIISASESMLVVYAALAGWPIATVPLGNLKTNGQAFGLFVLARAGGEDILLQFMAAYHGAFEGVARPSHLIE